MGNRKFMTLYKDGEKVGEFKTVGAAAAFVGCTRQNIQQNKRGAGLYIWKEYILTQTQTWEADALMQYKKLAKYITNPATAAVVYTGLKKLIAKIEGDVL